MRTVFALEKDKGMVHLGLVLVQIYYSGSLGAACAQIYLLELGMVLIQQR